MDRWIVLDSDGRRTAEVVIRCPILLLGLRRVVAVMPLWRALRTVLPENSLELPFVALLFNMVMLMMMMIINNAPTAAELLQKRWN